MCDEIHLARWARQTINRRTFGVTALAGAAAACTSMDGASSAATSTPALSESTVKFRTAAGVMDGFFVHPAQGRHPAVLFWPDVAGLRESKRQMARRLAGEGYAVLVVNPYYRDVEGQQYPDFASFAADNGFQKVRPWRQRLDAAAVGSDAQGAANWLFAQAPVDSSRSIGTEGYCMGGPFTVWSAAAEPRIGAAASFHGGGLVRDADTSPHKMLRGDARYLIAIAQDDDAEAPDHKDVLRMAMREAGATAKVDVYAGDHGWCVPDSPAYAPEAAEAAYADKLALYRAAL